MRLSGLVLLSLVAIQAWSAESGSVVGGVRYQIPDWFKESFLELADDASEAADEGRHVLLFMHLDGCPYCEAVLRESLIESDYSDWLRSRFDAIAINIRGAREVAFNEQLVVTEKQLARALKVRQTPTVLFLNGDNKVVLRVDGYRTAPEFKDILEYVDSNAYQTMDLEQYIAETAEARYAFRPHPAFRDITDLSAVSTPLMVLFEDVFCDGCNLLHDTLLADAEVNELLKLYTVVRLDAESVAPMIDPDGNRTTPRAWARALGMPARPGFVLFGGGQEQARIQGVLRHFHFTTAVRYVGERQYESYPSQRAYSRAYRKSLLDAGVDIDLGRQ